MNLLEEYKDLYYKEVEFNDRLNNKITTCISFMTVLGSALILLWTQVKYYGLYWYTILYFIFCTVNTIMFFVCIFMFFKTYSGYDRPTFPIKDIATQNTRVLNSVAPEQRDKANKLLEQKMAERFVNDAINNRKLNITKSEKHYRLIRMIMATFIVTFITFAINVSIDYYESKFVQEDINQIYIQGGEINVR